MIKKVLIGLLLTIIVIIAFNWELCQYGYFQAKGQIKVIVESRPIDEFINDPEFPDSLKVKLQLTKKIRQYAIDSLGLNNSSNYTKLFDQEGKTILWNLSASEPYALKAYEWEFPFLGAMPYKGFFDLNKAKVESENLSALGFDTRVRPVGGWSTLGILSDPILSNMLNRSDGALADVIIHELTHATLFVKGDISFNENLASFVGEKGAESFLKQSFGDSSTQFIEYIQAKEDQQLFTKVLLKGAQQLDSLYNSMTSVAEEEKAIKKKEAIEQIVNGIRKADFHNTNYQKVFDEQLPNNAYFMAQRRYHSQEDTLNLIYAQNQGSIKMIIDNLKKQHGK